MFKQTEIVVLRLAILSDLLWSIKLPFSEVSQLSVNIHNKLFVVIDKPRKTLKTCLPALQVSVDLSMKVWGVLCDPFA